MIDPETREVSRLTKPIHQDFGPSWGPHGDRIVFYSVRAGHPELYVTQLEPIEERRITFGRVEDREPK